MIYTIGDTETYMHHIKERVATGMPVLKTVGGSVWKTRKEAQKHCGGGFSVFGVLAEWDKDTVMSTLHNKWHVLLVNAELVILDSDITQETG